VHTDTRKKKVKKEKEDLDKKSKKGKEAEFERLLEEQLLFVSKQDMSSLHLLPESTIRDRSEQFIAEYYKNSKVRFPPVVASRHIASTLTHGQQEQSGLVLSWGANSDGVLGHTGGIEQLWPLAIESLSSLMVTAVAAGEFHSLCLTGARSVSNDPLLR
jgi:alpha-tubulin suppressor-like RCC1 family protein